MSDPARKRGRPPKAAGEHSVRFPATRIPASLSADLDALRTRRGVTLSDVIAAGVRALSERI
jgi:hypothetical protein